MFEITYNEVREVEEVTKIDNEILAKLKDNEIKISTYKMSRESIAIGNRQSEKYINFDKLQEDGVYIFRKITNGTAVYFGGSEVAMSVYIGKDFIKNTPRSVIEKKIIKILNDVFNELGIKSKIAKSGSRHEYIPAGCFNAITKNEIIYDDRKLIGSSFTKVGEKIFGNILFYMEDDYKNLDKYLVDNAIDKIEPISISEIDTNITKDDILRLFAKRFKL